MAMLMFPVEMPNGAEIDAQSAIALHPISPASDSEVRREQPTSTARRRRRPHSVMVLSHPSASESSEPLIMTTHSSKDPVEFRATSTPAGRKNSVTTGNSTGRPRTATGSSRESASADTTAALPGHRHTTSTTANRTRGGSKSSTATTGSGSNSLGHPKGGRIVLKNGTKHHGFDIAKAPYPLSYASTPLDLCVLCRSLFDLTRRSHNFTRRDHWDHMWQKRIHNSCSFVNYKEAGFEPETCLDLGCGVSLYHIFILSLLMLTVSLERR